MEASTEGPHMATHTQNYKWTSREHTVRNGFTLANEVKHCTYSIFPLPVNMQNDSQLIE